MNIAYVRVSTAEQNEDRQVQALQQFHIDKWFIDKSSAKDTNRPQLQKMLEYAREGDVVHIHDFSRLARSTKDLLSLVDYFVSEGIFLVSNKEHIDTSTATGRLMLTMIAAINEFEREIMLERQHEGIYIAKMKGLYKGRKATSYNDYQNFQKLFIEYQARQMSKAEFAKKLSISRPTLNKLIDEYLQTEK